MIKNEDYKRILKLMIACVNYGDYYSIKELSNLELEVMEMQDKIIKKEINKRKLEIRKNKQIPLQDWEGRKLISLGSLYSNYILEKIEKAKSLSELQLQAISIEEFVKNA